MLESLETIDWASLQGCDRPATDLPEWLRSLVSPVPEIRDRALDEIASAIFHQGTIYEATPAALPFLFELLENEDVPERESIVCLLTAISHCNPCLETNVTSEEERSRLDADFREQGSTFDEELQRERARVRAVKSMIAERFELIYPYLRFADDFQVRFAVAESLVRFPEFATRLRPDLEAALQSEPNKYVRGMLRFVIGGENADAGAAVDGGSV